MTEIEQRQPVTVAAVANLRQQAESMALAKQVADALCGTDMVPAHFKGKPANGAAAILYGAELGLNAIQSMQNIFVVQGRPSIYARTAVGLLRSRGVRISTVSSNDESVTVEAIRDGQTETATWDIARATKAGYVSNTRYKSNPQEMLYAKCAMEVARKIAPDILMGISFGAEELELEAPVRVQSSRVTVDEIVRKPEPAKTDDAIAIAADDADFADELFEVAE